MQIPEKLLNLSDVKIVDTKEKEGEVRIYVESTKDNITCRKCGQETTISHGYSKEIELRHLPIFGYSTYIIIKPKRGKCSNCDGNPTTSQRLSWYEYKSRNTKAYEDYLLLSLINSTISDVSLKEDIGYKSVEGIVERRLSDTVDYSSISSLGLIGIDEIALKKGYNNYVTIITSRVGKRIIILSVIEGKLKLDIKEFLNTIPTKLRKSIIGFCIDMNEGYSNAVSEVFGKNAQIIVDRFHVAQLYRKCFVTIRKSELKRLRKELSVEKYKDLSEAINILVANSENVSKKQREKLSKLFKYSPKLKLAYRFCRKLTSIFNSHIGIRQAATMIDEWIRMVNESELNCFDPFIKTLTKWKSKIVNYFKKRQNSGFVEGINNKIKVMKRRCYGIFNLKNLYKRIYLDLSGYEVFKAKPRLAINSN
jgi:transposase